MNRIRPVLVVGLAFAVLAACGRTDATGPGSTTSIVRTEASTATGSATPKAASAVTFVPLNLPVGSISTEVPAGWETLLSKDGALYQDPDTNQIGLRVDAGDGRQAPEDFVRKDIARTKPMLPEYHELRLTGRLFDTAKQKPYADWEYTHRDDDGTVFHTVRRVYGATFNKPNNPVAWVTVEFTAPADGFELTQTIFQHVVEKLTWDE